MARKRSIVSSKVPPAILLDTDAERRTSSGIPLKDLAIEIRHIIDWIDGVHGSAAELELPSISEVPIPRELLYIPRLHPDRPRGASAMADAHGANLRLRGCRPGAWLVSPKTGWHWAVWPNGEIGWLPKSIELPPELRVSSSVALPN
jgi:hypothetical protein